MDVLDLNSWKYYQEVPIIDHLAIAQEKEREEEGEGEGEGEEEVDQEKQESHMLLGGLNG